jgi:hypothetical protein
MAALMVMAGRKSSSESSCDGAKTLFRRFIKQAFLAIRKTHGRTRSGSRRWSKLLKHFEQRLLRHLLGVLAVAAHQPAIVENLRAEVFHKAVERLWFSSNQFPREFDFGITFQGRYRFSL